MCRLELGFVEIYGEEPGCKINRVGRKSYICQWLLAKVLKKEASGRWMKCLRKQQQEFTSYIQDGMYYLCVGYLLDASQHNIP